MIKNSKFGHNLIEKKLKDEMLRLKVLCLFIIIFLDISTIEKYWNCVYEGHYKNFTINDVFHTYNE